MFDVGFTELVLIFGIGLLILGPERLPRVASQIGRWVSRARRTATQLRRQLEREMALNDIRKPPTRKPPPPSAKPSSNDATSPDHDATPDPESASDAESIAGADSSSHDDAAEAGTAPAPGTGGSGDSGADQSTSKDAPGEPPSAS